MRQGLRTVLRSATGRSALLVTLMFLAFFTYALVQSQGFRLGARLFPLVVGWAGVIFASIELVRMALGLGTPGGGGGAADLSDGDADPGALWRGGAVMFLWLGGYYLLIYGVGMVVASALFTLVFLTFRCRIPLWNSILVSALASGSVFALAWLLALRLPRGVLVQWALG